jgi:hypothetical protein
MPGTIPQPKILDDPGILWIAPIGTEEPVPTETGGKFTDQLPPAWLLLGPTEEGSTFANSTDTDTITVAEFLNAIKNKVTGESASLAFALASWTLTNYRRALNGGVAALAPAGDGGVVSLEPPAPEDVVRCMLMWESTDSTLRILGRQCFQTGEVSSDFKPGTDKALIPCEYAFEQPTTGLRPWKMWGTSARVA